MAEFLIKIVQALAWPILLFLLLGWFYRKALIDLLNRVESVPSAAFLVGWM
jgi:hypothetical protein